MNKLFLFALMTCISALSMAQVNISGTVSDENEPVGEATVYIMDLGQVFEPGDTIATTTTNPNGFWSVDLEEEAPDSALFFLASTSACPDLLVGVVVLDNEAFVPLDCGTGFPGDSIPESVYIGAVPLNFEGDQWYFMSSVFGDPLSYNWTIDGNNYDTPDVTYTFPEEGEYTISLEVEMASGNILMDEVTINVITVPNCFALFFPFVDSTDSNQLLFINASIGDDLSYFWDFGDGNTSTEAYPTHTYDDDTLDYEVCLTITGEDCEDTFCLNLGEFANGGWIGGLVSGRNANEAKSDGFEFVVVPVPGEPLSTSQKEFELELITFPNPAQDMINIQFESETSESGQFRFLDMSGKLVQQQNVNIQDGTNRFDVDLSQLSEGIYIMFFESASAQRGVTKVVIQE